MTSRVRSLLLEPAPYMIEGWAEVDGMDTWLDHLETLSIAISQRRMTADQLDRYARLLRGMERNALTRAEAA